MVAPATDQRPTATPGPPSPARLLPAVFDAWRRALTVAGRGIVAPFQALARSHPVLAIRAALRYLRDPAATLAEADRGERGLLKEAGAVALALGVVLAFLVPSAFGVPLQDRFLAAGWTAAWALARLFIMRSLARRPLVGDLSRIDDAWGPGLLPYALAVASPLGLIALAASAWLTLRGLVAVDVEARESRRLVLWAFGGQLAAETASWLARGGLFVFLTLGR